jgi:hypothetical protein
MATSVSNAIETINSTQSLILIKNMSVLSREISFVSSLFPLFPGFDYQFHLSVICAESSRQSAFQVFVLISFP